MKKNTKEFKFNPNFFNVIMCPYEDRTLAFWMKLAFTFIWAVSIPNGILYGVSSDYVIALSLMVLILILNMVLCHLYYRRWIDFVTFFALCIPVFYIFFHANIGFFSAMFSLIFSCGVVFILGIRNSLIINLCSLLTIIICFRFHTNSPTSLLYGENVSLRFPYLFVCFVAIAYCLMYMIQRFWVEKRHRTQILEERISNENKKLETISMNIMNAMIHALDAKISGEASHCRSVAEYAKEIATRKGLDKELCTDAYRAGLLHEIGMVGIPDALIQNNSLTETEYEVFKTYVEKGYHIIDMLETSETQRIAEAVLYHRDNYDGTGYHTGLYGEDIPLLARIVSVADYADRHLKRGESPSVLTEHLISLQGSRFDPECTTLMIEILKSDIPVKESFK